MKPTRANTGSSPVHRGNGLGGVASAAAPILIGLLLRLWLIAKFSQIQGDSLLYGDIARNWLQHGVYSFSHALNEPPHPTLIRLPGYPLFLAACFRIFGVGQYGAVLLVQAAIDLLSCALLAGLARRLFSPRAALPALWLGALCPFTAAYVAAPLTETLTLFCIALTFYALERWRNAASDCNRWLYVIAAALAYSILLRPEQGMLAACVVPTVLWMSYAQHRPGGILRAARPALLVSLLTLLPLVPWTLRNERIFHVFQPLAPRYANDPGERNPSGFQRWYRTWAIDYASTESTYWPYEGSDINIQDLPSRAFDSPAQYAKTDALFDDYNVNTTSTPAIDNRFNALALERSRAHPLRTYVALPLARLADMAFRPRAETLPLPAAWWSYRQHPRGTLIALAMAAINLAYFALGTVGFRARKSLIPNDYNAQVPLIWCMVATIVLRSSLLLTLDNAETRYTLEFFPILIIFGAGLLATYRHSP